VVVIYFNYVTTVNLLKVLASTVRPQTITKNSIGHQTSRSSGLPAHRGDTHY